MQRKLSQSACWLIVASLVLAGACKKQNQDMAATTADTTAPAAAPAPPAAATAPAENAQLNDPQIAQVALAVNSADSARGVMAEQKGTNAEVKSFARLMVSDHGALNKKAVDLAQKLNVTPQTSPDEQQLAQQVTQMTQNLQGMTGAAFDSTYIDQEVAIHKEALDMLDQKLIPQASNPQLKDLLQTARSAVDGHLKRAQDIQAKMQKAPGSA